ncbi:MAG TPA: ABC transporter substrate-binding protein, partial [Chloroflexota bacterium]|nr:ABC transporter substrate-binding protein [Chloroflexota bacterium]
MAGLHPRTPGLTVALALCLFLCACASPERNADQTTQQTTSAPAAPKRIVAAIMGEPTTLSQKLNAAGAGSIPGTDALEQLVNAGLSLVDGRGALRPQLAEAVPTVENGLWTVHPDGRMDTTWHIRPGAQWHDGVPVTSADVVFTLTVGRDRDLAAFRDI